MPIPPPDPKIYHITHVENLPPIVAAGILKSDARILAEGGPNQMIGMSRIKERRLTKINLEECYPETFVGEYVPFYFCPRSVMLYLIAMRNVELTYKGGQGPIVHLEASLHRVIEWAQNHDRRWAYSFSSAAAYGVEFSTDTSRLDEINWPAVATNSWSNPTVKHGKQAEFLLYESFPWELVERIGVQSMTVGRLATSAVSATDHRPPVEVLTSWYY